ncbi:hypothetical protein ACIP9X_19235 [Arthrobacter sp. NPDC093125]|uniref:hypothetical protein n=1 Tax=Arthrobacter sp. NPDC093125 TaxID=3363944 RepID=UPI0037F22AD1
MRMFIRKLTTLALASGTAVGGSLLVGGNAANAAAAEPNQGAFVIKDQSCAGPNPNGGFLFTNDTHIVVTPSGNIKLTCHFDGPPAKETVNRRGFLCFALKKPTYDSHFVYTKSGQGTLTCHIKAE